MTPFRKQMFAVVRNDELVLLAYGDPCVCDTEERATRACHPGEHVEDVMVTVEALEPKKDKVKR